MKPQAKIFRITKEELDSVQIPGEADIVIVHIPHLNEDTKTASGIFVVGDQDYKPALHAERWGYVYKTCTTAGHIADRTAEWETIVEVEVGDKVWFDFREALYAHTFLVDGEWYKVLNYKFLHMALRGEKVIPLNGYVMFKPFTPELEHELLVTTHKDDRLGIVAYTGRPNDAYDLDFYSDNIDIKEGDHVLFEESTACFPLESEMHSEFSKETYVLQQRKKIIAIVSEDHKEIIKLHKKVIGVKVREWKQETSGIKLLKNQNNNRIGVVGDSSHKEMKEGTVVVIPRKKGTIFNELEYYTEDRIIYYEV